MTLKALMYPASNQRTVDLAKFTEKLKMYAKHNNSGIVLPLDFQFMNAKFQCSLLSSIKLGRQRSKNYQYKTLLKLV